MSRIKVDTATNKLATGPVDFPDGITGVAATFTGNVTVGGTITYDDVQNVDSVGIVTAGKGFRATTGGIVVTAGVSTLGGGTTMADSVVSYWGTGGDLEVFSDGSNGVLKGLNGRIYQQSDTGINFTKLGNAETFAILTPDGSCEFYHDNSKKLETTADGITVTGAVTDTKGDVRDIPKHTQAGTYTLVAADAGKFIEAGNTVEIPPSVFSAGKAITIVNQTAGDITITEGSGLTLYNSADGTNGNLTLSTRGVATVLFASGTTAHISGNVS